MQDVCHHHDCERDAGTRSFSEAQRRSNLKKHESISQLLKAAGGVLCWGGLGNKSPTSLGVYSTTLMFGNSHIEPNRIGWCRKNFSGRGPNSLKEGFFWDPIGSLLKSYIRLYTRSCNCIDVETKGAAVRLHVLEGLWLVCAVASATKICDWLIRSTGCEKEARTCWHFGLFALVDE